MKCKNVVFDPCDGNDVLTIDRKHDLTKDLVILHQKFLQIKFIRLRIDTARDTVISSDAMHYQTTYCKLTKFVISNHPFISTALVKLPFVMMQCDANTDQMQI